jgi:hypothetical protein
MLVPTCELEHCFTYVVAFDPEEIFVARDIVNVLFGVEQNRNPGTGSFDRQVLGAIEGRRSVKLVVRD